MPIVPTFIVILYDVILRDIHITSYYLRSSMIHTEVKVDQSAVPRDTQIVQIVQAHAPQHTICVGLCGDPCNFTHSMFPFFAMITAPTVYPGL